MNNEREDKREKKKNSLSYSLSFREPRESGQRPQRDREIFFLERFRKTLLR